MEDQEKLKERERSKNIRLARIAKCQCDRCGKDRTSEFLKCDACRDYCKKNKRLKRKKRRVLGRCVDCDDPAVGGGTRCVNHKSIQEASQKKIRARRIAHNICVWCENPRCANNNKCEDCVVKQACNNAQIPRSDWMKIKKIFDDQGGICPYTGQVINIGLDAHLDHIYPTYLGGSNDLENLQWIYSKINIMKSAIPESEFISLCKMVVNHLDSRNNL